MKPCPNPACTATLANSALVCNACGWEAPKGTAPLLDPNRHLCASEDRDQRCTQAGSLSAGTRGEGPWFCHVHFPPFRNWQTTRRDPPTPAFRDLSKRLHPVAKDVEAIAERLAIQTEQQA